MIILLDSDDLFVNENLFGTCYQEAKSNDIDIIEFSGFESYTRFLKENGKLPVIPLYELFRRLNWTLKPGLYKENKNYFIELLNEILKGKYISINSKNRIFNLIKKFK